MRPCEPRECQSAYCAGCIQASIFMMSLNLQATKDRLDAAHEYKVNLKAKQAYEYNRKS